MFQPGEDFVGIDDIRVFSEWVSRSGDTKVIVTEIDYDARTVRYDNGVVQDAYFFQLNYKLSDVSRSTLEMMKAYEAEMKANLENLVDAIVLDEERERAWSTWWQF
jgi:hypothetical protein